MNAGAVGTRDQQHGSNTRRKKRKFSGPRNVKESCIGHRGILITCSPGQEAACRREAYHLLLEYFELFREKKKDIELSGNDLNQELSLEDELKQLRKQTSKTGLPNASTDLNMFYTIEVGVKGSVFFAFHSSVDVEPCEMVEKIMQDVERTKVRKCRYSVRFIPVDGICYARKEEASRLFCELLEKKLKQWKPLEKNSFAVVFRKRNNSGAHRNDFIEAIAQHMPSCFHVNLDKPNITILVEVLKTSCLIAIVENYDRYCKFNVHELWERLEMSEKNVQ